MERGGSAIGRTKTAGRKMERGGSVIGRTKEQLATHTTMFVNDCVSPAANSEALVGMRDISLFYHAWCAHIKVSPAGQGKPGSLLAKRLIEMHFGKPSRNALGYAVTLSLPISTVCSGVTSSDDVGGMQQCKQQRPASTQQAAVAQAQNGSAQMSANAVTSKVLANLNTMITDSHQNQRSVSTNDSARLPAAAL